MAWPPLTKLLRERGWYHCALSAPVHKIVADKNAIGVCVVLNIGLIRLTTRETVVRIFLVPCAILFKVDVVTESNLLAAEQIWPLRFEAWISPILVERHSFTDSHCEYQSVAAFARLAARTYDPIVYLGSTPNFGLAGCECAKIEEWIGREPEVASYYIGVELCHRITDS
jgi:hypothetical protein